MRTQAVRMLALVLALLLLGAACVAHGTADSKGASPVSAPAPRSYDPPGETKPALEHEAEIDISFIEVLIHDLTNDERGKVGLSSLEWNPDLNRIAGEHSQDMASRGYFSHTSPEGYDSIERCRQARFPIRKIPAGGDWYTLGCVQNYYLGCAENIFRCSLVKGQWYAGGALSGLGYYTEEEIASLAVQGWMGSPGHKENILGAYWESEGIGVAISSDALVYVTQNFN